VAWFDETATPLDVEAWADGIAQRLVLRRAVLNGVRIDITLALLNASDQPGDFTPPNPDLPWEIILDSANPISPPGTPAVDQVHVAAHSLVLLACAVPR
jgi:glycogen operon protein